MGETFGNFIGGSWEAPTEPRYFEFAQSGRHGRYLAALSTLGCPR